MPKLQDLVNNIGTLIYKQLQPGNLFVDERSYGVDKVLLFIREEVPDDASAPLAGSTGATLKCFFTHLIMDLISVWHIDLMRLFSDCNDQAQLSFLTTIAP